MTARERARGVALSGLALRDGVTGAARRALARPRVHVLCLHHLFEDEARGFERLLRRLMEQHEFVGFGEAVRAIVDGTGASAAKPLMTVTFDDGFASCMVGARVMDALGVKACFYVCPSIVGERDEGKVRAFCEGRLKTLPQRFMGWDDLGALRGRGHEVGSHTMTHPEIATLGDAEIAEELGRSREVIADRLGVCDHFAWPFGLFRHVTASTERIAAEAGYASVASAERGSHLADAAVDAGELCLRRDNVEGGWPLGHSMYLLARSAGSGRVRGEWGV